MSKEKARYVGPDGFINHDVARDVGGGAKMNTGEVYEVSPEMFASLMLSADWEPETGSKTRAKNILADAQKNSDALSRAVPEGMGYEELVASQEEHVKVQDVDPPESAAEVPPEEPQDEQTATSSSGKNSKGGDSQ